jgi:hypothetical protein
MATTFQSFTHSLVAEAEQVRGPGTPGGRGGRIPRGCGRR